MSLLGREYLIANARFQEAILIDRFTATNAKGRQICRWLKRQRTGYDYLVDVLQRVGTHPAADVAQLTPRQWKVRFADNPLRSDLSRITPKPK